MAEPRTRARTAQSKKEEEQQEEKQSAAEREAEKKAEKEKVREEKEKEKQEQEQKARQAKIDSGDLIEGDGVEFEKGTKETKVFNQVQDLITTLQESSEPLVFSDTCKELDIAYPEDLVPAMHALEQVNLVERYDAKRLDNGGNRRTAAYKWVG